MRDPSSAAVVAGPRGLFGVPTPAEAFRPHYRTKITPAPALQPQSREPQGGEPLDLEASMVVVDGADPDILYLG